VLRIFVGRKWHRVSDLLGNLETYIRTLPKADVRVVLGQAPLADQPMKADVEANQGGRDLAEDGGIRAIDVGGAARGKFTCFMDGMQRPRGPIYINGPVPIIYGYVAAAVRVRGTDRRMRTLQGYHDVNEALYFPRKLAERYGLSITGVHYVDTSNDETIEHPLALAQAAHDKISNVRQGIESGLTSRWVAQNVGSDEWLLVDGGLQSDYGEAGNVVGVTKSHGTQYLTWEEQSIVLGLRVGERSGAFVPIVRGRRRPVYSWYLRLHPNDGRDVYFGLIRVEAAAKPETVAAADEISSWLMAERSPLSLPDGRWDKLLYPIRDCEQYLRSIAPSRTMMEAALAGA
jgi:hypothetical protein